MPPVSIPPAQLRGIAALLEEKAGELQLLYQRGLDLDAGDAFGLRSAIVSWSTGHATELRTAATLVEDRALAPSNWATIAQMYGLPPELELDPQRLRTLTADLQDALAALPAEASAAERADAVAAFFASLDSPDQALLVAGVPELIGNLDGVPNRLRYAANRISVQRTLADERARLAAWQPPPGREDLSYADYQRLMGRIATYERLLTDTSRAVPGPDGPRVQWSPGANILVFSRPEYGADNHPVDDGRLAVVVGDLDTAVNVGVVVPGITNRIDNYEATLRRAQDIQDQQPMSATIAWLGYDTPEFADAVLTDDAERGSAALHRFVDGLRRSPGSQVTVIAHSYGTVVTSFALQRGMRPDQVILMGSPGLGPDVDSAADLGLPVGYPIYAMRAPADFVSLSASHGMDPAEMPGVTRLDTDWTGAEDVVGHSDYTKHGTQSLRNVIAAFTQTGAPHLTDTHVNDEGFAGPYNENIRNLIGILQSEVPPEVVFEFAAELEIYAQHAVEGGTIDRTDAALAAIRAAQSSAIFSHLTYDEAIEAIRAAGFVDTTSDLVDQTVDDAVRGALDDVEMPIPLPGGPVWVPLPDSVADVAGEAAGGVSAWVTDRLGNVVIDNAKVIDDVVYQVIAVGNWVDDRVDQAVEFGQAAVDVTLDTAGTVVEYGVDRVEDAVEFGGDVVETGADVAEEVGRRIWDLWP